MPFSEKVKLIAKRKAFFRCVICRQPFVEVHHILPESEGGKSTLDNACPLCAGCHDLFGGNPEKRKQLRQMRDQWYEEVERLRGRMEILDPIEVDLNNRNAMKSGAVGIYHLVEPDEDFGAAARDLAELLRQAQQQHPNQKRILYLDIDGHRNGAGGFDDDMLELQGTFVLEVLFAYLSEVHMPLAHARNKKMQRNDVPGEIVITGKWRGRV